LIGEWEGGCPSKVVKYLTKGGEGKGRALRSRYFLEVRGKRNGRIEGRRGEHNALERGE